MNKKQQPLWHRLFLVVLLSLYGWGAMAYAQKAKRQALPNKPKTKVACIGNSVTYGTGIENREQWAYPVQLQQMLGEAYEVGSFAKPGATLLNKGHRPFTQQVEYQQALDFRADIAVIHLGLNDTDPRNWPHYQDEFVADYSGIIGALRQANPRVRIILAKTSPITVAHRRFLAGTRDWQAQVNRAIEQVAMVNGLECIDFNAPLYPHPNLLPDAIHPNAEGATHLARTAYSAITGDFGGLQLPALYTDGMVLQRNAPLHLKGTANAGERIKVKASWGDKAITEADRYGRWEVVMDTLRAGGPYQLEVQGESRKLHFQDVLIGEVWLCSGQSNIAWKVKQSHTAHEAANANDPQLRLYNMDVRWHTDNDKWSIGALDSVNRLDYFTTTSWQAATPERVANFSAVAYHFGRMLRDSLKVPVGLVCNAVGGSGTEAWIGRDVLEWEYPQILTNWQNSELIMDWCRGRAARNIEARPHALQRHPYEPTYLFDAGIRPLAGYGMRGVLWYQGESNADKKEIHASLFTLLQKSWRKYLDHANLPFYTVQLSSLNRPAWPQFRASQLELANTLPHTYMVTTIDVGDSTDVHPRRKKPVGERLALQALYHEYQQKHLTPAGPTPIDAYPHVSKLRVEFEHGQGLQAQTGERIIGFEIADLHGHYYPAEVKVLGHGLLELSHPEVKYPQRVRYGWQPFTRANLVNSAGLPTPTFQLEAGPKRPVLMQHSH